ncbi:MAG: hypothetical protein K2Q24_17305 [Chitinophagaceae bacterium]|jgi:hypothetical protein|nr:hypothetical protein [Chitinophagaceae bacterium]
MKLFFLACCISICVQEATAQDHEKKKSDYKLALRISPLGLVDPVETNFSAGVERKLSPKFSVGGDAAVYIARDVLTDRQPMSGFHLRPTVRWYSGKRLKGFTELVLMYKHTVRKQNDWLGMDCVNEVPAYEKFTTFKQIRDVFDLSFRAGVQEQLFNSEKWKFEFYMGLGLRQKFHRIKYSEKNTCAANEFADFFPVFDQSSTGSFTSISIPFGIRLVYQIK